MTQETKNLIKIDVTPDNLRESLPINFGEYEGGFSDRELDLEDGFKYEISYDGEGELLATITSKPEGIENSIAEDLLRTTFAEPGTDDEDDEDEDEEEEVTP